MADFLGSRNCYRGGIIMESTNSSKAISFFSQLINYTKRLQNSIQCGAFNMASRKRKRKLLLLKEETFEVTVLPSGRGRPRKIQHTVNVDSVKYRKGRRSKTSNLQTVASVGVHRHQNVGSVEKSEP